MLHDFLEHYLDNIIRLGKHRLFNADIGEIETTFLTLLNNEESRIAASYFQLLELDTNDCCYKKVFSHLRWKCDMITVIDKYFDKAMATIKNKTDK